MKKILASTAILFLGGMSALAFVPHAACACMPVNTMVEQHLKVTHELVERFHTEEGHYPSHEELVAHFKGLEHVRPMDRLDPGPAQAGRLFYQRTENGYELKGVGKDSSILPTSLFDRYPVLERTP
jgi:hypothetical protein